MRVERGYRSKDVEDARGDAPARRRGGGGTALKLGGGGGSSGTGANVGQQGAPGPSQPAPQGPPAGAPDPQSDAVDLVNQVTDDIQRVFAAEFAREGLEYRRAKLRLFRDAVDTGCGMSSAQIGPFYCPPDEKAYIDLSFYDDLRARFGAPGDFAQAYVIAHEFGHHVQNLLGIDERVAREAGNDKRKQNELSVRQELQADCFAGVWAAHADPKLAIDPDDIEEAMTAARAIGDDRLQKQAGQAVDPRSFTHGTSAQRAQWFRTGREAGTLGACDTFAVERP